MMDFKEKRMSIAQLVLLGIFILGLGLAWLMVKTRSHITLSKPYSVPVSGLKISVPEGAGWHSRESWGYARNSLSLICFYGQDSREATTQLTVSLNLAVGKTTPEQQIQTFADGIGGLISDVKTFKAKDPL